MESGNLEYAMFSRGEMDGRYSKARRLMGDQDLDALFISGEENFQYFAGTSASLALHHSLTRPSMFVLPLDGEPMAITQGIDNLSVSSYVTETRGYSEILSFPHQTVLEAFNELANSGAHRAVRLLDDASRFLRPALPINFRIEYTGINGDHVTRLAGLNVNHVNE